MWDKGAANILGDFNSGRCPTTEGLTTGTATNLHQNPKFAHLCNLLDCFRNPNLITADRGFATFRLVNQKCRFFSYVEPGIMICSFLQAFETVLDMMVPSDMKEVEHEEGEHVEDGGRTRILTNGSQFDQKGESLEVNLSNIRFIPDPNPVTLENDLKQDKVKRNLLCRFLFVVQYFCMPAKPKGYAKWRHGLSEFLR